MAAEQTHGNRVVSTHSASLERLCIATRPNLEGEIAGDGSHGHQSAHLRCSEGLGEGLGEGGACWPACLSAHLRCSEGLGERGACWPTCR